MKQKHESKNRWEYPNNKSGMLYKFRMTGSGTYVDFWNKEFRDKYNEIDVTQFLSKYVLTDNFARVIWPASLSDRILRSIGNKTVSNEMGEYYLLPVQVENPKYSARGFDLFDRIYAPKITNDPEEITDVIIHESMASSFTATVIGMEQIIDCSSLYLRSILGIKNL